MGRQLTGSGLRGVVRDRLKNVWVAIVAVAILLWASSCDTSNVGNGINPARMTLDVYVPADLYDGWPSTWSASWTGGTAPYTLAWVMGGGAYNNVVVADAQVSPVTQDFCMEDDGFGTTYTYLVTLTDAAGLVANTSGTYILSPTGNMQPRIDALTYEDGVLSVYVSDGDDSYITVTIDPGSHFIVDKGNPSSNTKTIGPPDGAIPEPCQRGIEGIATFEIALNTEEILTGASGMITVTVADDSGGASSDTLLIMIDPLTLEPDTLYALALDSGITVGDPVTIIIATGATGSFQFMLGVGVVLESDASYVGGSFNVGNPGGARDDADGVWADITIDGGFALGPDLLIMPGNNPEDSLGTNYRLDFNISPLRIGTDPTEMDVPSVTGALFNFQVSYSSAGEKQVSFQEVNGVNRTFYSDFASGESRFWSAFEGATIIVN